MFAANRRFVLQSFALGAGTLAASPSFAVENDGHAAGYDVSGASEYLKTVPRKSGDPVVFTASLDKAPIKATSGGWAREITTRGLPIATAANVTAMFQIGGTIGAVIVGWAMDKARPARVISVAYLAYNSRKQGKPIIASLPTAAPGD